MNSGPDGPDERAGDPGPGAGEAGASDAGDVGDAGDAGDAGGVGSVGEEAAKLLGALSGWAHDLGDHIDTGAAECRVCPICRTVHLVRETSPEVREHLVVAATSLMQAASGVLAAAARAGERGRTDTGVEHIDLTEDDWPEEDE